MRRQAGFTLAEMAIVLLLAGLMLSAGLGVFSSQVTNSAISVTKQRQQAINDALMAYFRVNFRLPCPDSPLAVAPNVLRDGIEDRVNVLAAGPPPVPNTLTACRTNYGLVPYTTLNLPREVAMDGWEGFFFYQVSNVTTNWTLTSSFNPSASTGDITVTNGVNGGAVTQAANVAAVVISYGKNQSGAMTTKGTLNAAPVGADEISNTRPNPPPAAPAVANLFVKRDYNDTPGAAGGSFDDMVSYLQPQAMLAPLRNDGTLKAESDKLEAFLFPIYSAAMADTANCIPPYAAPGSCSNSSTGLDAGTLSTTSIYGVVYNTTATVNVCYVKGTPTKIATTDVGSTPSPPPVTGSTIAFTVTVKDGTTIRATIPRTVEDVRNTFAKYGKALCT